MSEPYDPTVFFILARDKAGITFRDALNGKYFCTRDEAEEYLAESLKVWDCSHLKVHKVQTYVVNETPLPPAPYLGLSEIDLCE